MPSRTRKTELNMPSSWVAVHPRGFIHYDNEAFLLKQGSIIFRRITILKICIKPYFLKYLLASEASGPHFEPSLPLLLLHLVLSRLWLALPRAGAGDRGRDYTCLKPTCGTSGKRQSRGTSWPWLLPSRRCQSLTNGAQELVDVFFPIFPQEDSSESDFIRLWRGYHSTEPIFHDGFINEAWLPHNDTC